MAYQVREGSSEKIGGPQSVSGAKKITYARLELHIFYFLCAARSWHIELEEHKETMEMISMDCVNSIQ